jgi:carbamoyltransferase
MDLARSVQVVTEEIMLRMARSLHAQTGMDNLCLAGGVALNCVGNGRLLREGPFKELWIQPAAGDAGGALGVAQLIHHRYLKQPRKVTPGRDSMKGAYLGPAFTPEEIETFLKAQGAAYQRLDRPTMMTRVASQIADEKIIGWFNGRMEFGPRALGCRSIIGDPRSPRMQADMNIKIKFREGFRPFAPSVLKERAADYFELKGAESPYMLLVAPVREDRRLPINPGVFDSDDDDDMLRVVNQPRSDLPAITHVDHSARVQTVNKQDHPEFHRLISAFKKQTGVGVLVNTSFNVRGEPIVCSPKDAYTCFMRTGMDVLVLEEFVLWKDKQPKFDDNEDWKEEYGRD